MKLSLQKCFFAILLILNALGTACSASTIAEQIEEELSENASISGSAVKLSFDFAITIDSIDDGFDYTIGYPHHYDAVFYFDSDGTTMLTANDFPRMMYRICAEDSDTDDCDKYYNPDDYDVETEGNDIDIVVDACGPNVDDSLCGDDDETVYTGTLDTNGTMRLDNVSFRVRFFIATAETNGLNADDSDTGLIPSEDSIRLTISKITTGRVSISGGDNLTATGSSLSSRQIILVGGGIIPADVPALGGSYFIGTIDGTFSSDPLELLESSN